MGTWDNKDLVYSFAAMNVVTGQLTTRLVESPADAKRRTGHSKTARLQQAFATHLRDVARAYPAALGKPVLLTIDNAPWHQGTRITEGLTAHPHLRLYRLPSYSPQLLISSSDCGAYYGDGPLTIGSSPPWRRCGPRYGRTSVTCRPCATKCYL